MVRSIFNSFDPLRLFAVRDDGVPFQVNRQLLLRDQLRGVMHPVFSLDVTRAFGKAWLMRKLLNDCFTWLVRDEADRLPPSRFYRLHRKAILLRRDSFNEF